MSYTKKEILNILKNEILSLELKPGTIISEAILTERFSLSRTPIRDILKQLSLEGYIDIYPQKGSIVSYIDLESVEQIIFLRSTIEKEIIKELCGNIGIKGIHELNNILYLQHEYLENEKEFKEFIALDDEFHKILFKLDNRKFLWNIIKQFNVHYSRYRKLHMLKKNKLIAIYDEHKSIVDYIINDKKDKIDNLINDHIKADINSKYLKENFSEYIKK